MPAIQVFDFGCPKVITGIARETISGGQFVYSSGATGVVDSTYANFVSSDIKLAVASDGVSCNGIALNTATSGNKVSFAVDGVFIQACSGSVFGGYKVTAGTNFAIQNVGSQAVPASAEDASMAGKSLGRALTAGASGGYAVFQLIL